MSIGEFKLTNKQHFHQKVTQWRPLINEYIVYPDVAKVYICEGTCNYYFVAHLYLKNTHVTDSFIEILLHQWYHNKTWVYGFDIYAYNKSAGQSQLYYKSYVECKVRNRNGFYVYNDLFHIENTIEQLNLSGISSL